MITGTTTSGFAFELQDAALDDYELVEALVKVDNGDNGQLIFVVAQLLGEAQKEALKEHLRDENGKVSAVRMFQEIAEILAAAKETKNSLSSPTCSPPIVML